MVMASAGVNMPGGGDGNPAAASFSSTPECRMRRRRRLAPPPAAAAAAGSSEGSADRDAAAGPSRGKSIRPASPATSSSSPSAGPADSDGEEELDAEEEQELQPLPPAGPPQLPAAAAAQAWPVAFGSLSVAGRSRDMEDTVSLRPGFHTWLDGSPMHFFGVFDGHGGSHVAELCRDKMHVFLAEELAAEEATFAQRRQQQAAAGEGTSAVAWAPPQEEEEERAWRAALARTFRRIDAMASLACACGRIVSPACRCPLSGNSGIVGSTAVVAVLVRGRVVVANCGDSRAVLCRGPGGAPPVPLSDDHKVPVRYG